jgi:Response regulator containing a CheY-like receiver domain and an HTH DNA-binding domain
MTPLRVFLADDHAVVREGLKALINSNPEMEVIGEAADGTAAVAKVAELDPDVVVMDVSMPGLNGAKATAAIKEAKPSRKVLALTLHEERSYVRLLLDAGASGYVLKRSAADELIHAIKAVADGRVYLDPSLAGGVLDSLRGKPTSSAAGDADLSQREAEVLRLIALGYSNKEIAAKLELSVKTVETYKKRSVEKLGLRSRVDIVRYAAEQGWTSDE